ncbi:hypothetical protein KFE25_010626 [Diacronema lutheri]|uniref:Uncharacterized protein n=1 Tax=Diacronema lutheri TaxID=2081491 RepID=A0A8J5XDR8_DIALT|nr:hypothetical protein KFE25_010626 [Diacronema lutheri]
MDVNVRRCPEWQRRQRSSLPHHHSFGGAALPSGSTVLFASESALGLAAPARIVYKAVATEERDAQTRYFSIFAGRRLEYKIGRAASGLKHGSEAHGGVFCYQTVAQALEARVPARSAMRKAPRAVLACRPASADGTKLGAGKIRYSTLIPVARLDVDATLQPEWRR